MTTKPIGAETNPVEDERAVAGAPAAGHAARVVGLCFLISLFEGIDIQSMGIAAPRLAPEYGLTPAQLAQVITPSVVGLFVGSMIGGRLADLIGRRWVLILSTAIFGIFSLLTTLPRDLTLLIAIRFVAGLGMGGAFPNLIAMAAEAVSPKHRGRAISLMYCGMPCGGTIVGLLAYFGGPGMDWRNIFYLGGWGPLLAVPILFLFLPESSQFKAAKERAKVRGDVRAEKPQPIMDVLFGGGRAPATLMLWICFFFTLVVVYLLLSWIPQLMVGKGLTPGQGAAVSAVLNIGAICGSLSLGRLFDTGRRKLAIGVMYIGLVTALALLAQLQGFGPLAAAGFAAGFFAIGGQLVLYALAPGYYGTLVRGTGVGAAVTAGRLGSITAPLMVGAILQAGYTSAHAIGAAIPGLVLAAIAAWLLIRRPGETD